MKSAAGSATYLNGPTDEMFQYYLNFAKGGVSFTMMEYIDWLGPIDADARPNGEGDDEVMAWGQRLVEACEAEGMYLGVQFVPLPLQACDDMTTDDIAAFEQGAVDYCLWYQEMGFKGIGFHMTGNTLCTQFLSRYYNHRSDEYGPQSIENRSRIVVETVQKIKEACGRDFIIEALMEGVVDDDNLTNNIGEAFSALDIEVNLPYNEQTTFEEELAFAQVFEAAGMDALCIRLGIKDYHPCQFGSDLYFSLNGLEGMNPWGYQYDFNRHFQGLLDGSHQGAGMLLEVTRRFKEVVDIPVGTVTYMDPAHAPDFFEDALAQGKADYYTMTRPLTVDPEYVNKLQEGRLDEIAPCCRCLHCHIGSNEANRSMGYCRVNALTQRVMTENGPASYGLEPAAAAKRVMVVGGGPAGMEAARIAALRGHDVTLYEKSSSLGGKLSTASLVKGPHENLDDLVAYLERQLELAGVKTELNTEIDAALVSSVSPDALVLATGALPADLDVAGDGVSILPYEAFMGDGVGSSVVVYGSNAQAFDAALWLTVHGKKVTIVTPNANEDLDLQQSQHQRRFMLTALYSLGVKVWPGSEIAELGSDGITIHTAYGVDARIECDAVINAVDGLPNTELIDEVAVSEAYAIGDCSEPFNIALAIRGGNDVGRAL
jgi:2,4-dienoyl-CoA reductase-like NADH-dependent reductase (Old Yellow Enzyme family)/NADPH-dependent 2,4-dienoyl-CoA reductase/sulfur reductase-like enzyme